MSPIIDTGDLRDSIRFASEQANFWFREYMKNPSRKAMRIHKKYEAALIQAIRSRA